MEISETRETEKCVNYVGSQLSACLPFFA